MNYTIKAFDYDLVVGGSPSGKWYGGYREPGSPVTGGYTVVGEFDNARTAKIETCRAVQRLTANTSNSPLDPCEDLLDEWAVE
jgi:hypothetical protein